jgi:hypothetical protein
MAFDPATPVADAPDCTVMIQVAVLTKLLAPDTPVAPKPGHQAN